MANNFPSLLVSIDEFTITILTDQKLLKLNWITTAEKWISEFLKQTDIEKIMGRRIEEMTCSKPQGYTKAYNLGVTDYYVAFAYHEFNPDMGVCIKFSAKIWAIYQHLYMNLMDKKILFSEFFNKIATNIDATVRLTRIDLTADFYNYNINLSDLYENIKNSSILIQNATGRSPIKTFRFYGKNSNVETIYIGSQKANSRSFLRIYDKKKEQIDKNSFRLQEALSVHDWTRFEAVFKGQYAHRISETILSTSMSEEELTAFIAKLITQKYRLFDITTNEYLKVTSDLIEIASSSNCNALRIESPRDNTLSQNISHLRCGSGYYPTLYKIKKLCGENTLKKFLTDLYHEFQSGAWITPSVQNELNIWLKKHSALTSEKLEDNY